MRRRDAVLLGRPRREDGKLFGELDEVDPPDWHRVVPLVQRARPTVVRLLVLLLRPERLDKPRALAVSGLVILWVVTRGALIKVCDEHAAIHGRARAE